MNIGKFIYWASTVLILVNTLVALLFLSLTKSNIGINPSYFVYILAFLNVLIATIFIIVGIINTDSGNFAKTSIICSLLFWFPAINLISCILAIVFGIASIRRKEKGLGLAIAGLTIGIITVIFAVVGSLVYYFSLSIF